MQTINKISVMTLLEYIAIVTIVGTPLALTLFSGPADGADQTLRGWMIATRSTFVILSLIFFMRIRDKGGAAAIFFLLYFWTSDYLNFKLIAEYPVADLLGVGFGATIFFALFRWIEIARYRKYPLSSDVDAVDDNGFESLSIKF